MKYLVLVLIISILIGCKKEDEKEIIPEKIETVQNDTLNQETDQEMIWNGFPKTGKTIQDFVKNSEYEIVEEYVGKLNNDNFDDSVLVVREIENNTSNRIMLVLMNNNNKNLTLFSKNETFLGPEYNEYDYKIHDTENIEINNHLLKIELYNVGPYGNLFGEFELKENDLKLTSLETYNMGAGSQIGQSYNNKTKIAIITFVNTMTDEMKSEEEEINVNYKKSTYFSNLDVDALVGEIMGQSKNSL